MLRYYLDKLDDLSFCRGLVWLYLKKRRLHLDILRIWCSDDLRYERMTY